MKKGIVFDIQRFSIHDGPGIRTTVFMKGCPLRCQWCSNPESQRGKPQIITRDIKCSGCGACVGKCRQHAISLSQDKKRHIDWERCDQCLECADACIYGALAVVGKSMEIEDVVNEVASDRVFYDNSGGGITVSGGEPTQQSDFVTGLLYACKEKGFHTALETCGYGPESAFKAMLEHIDLVLFDIKHIDAEQHRQYTGVDNKLILTNLEFIAKTKRAWLRVPLIAGFNDSSEHMEEIFCLAKKLNIERISLLPYHEGGVSKAAQIGVEYLMDGAKRPDDDHIDQLAQIGSKKGLHVTIGR